MAELTPKETLIVKAKVDATLNGESQNSAARKLWPNQTPGSAAVSMTTALKKPNIQEAIAAEFKKQGIDLETVLSPVVKSLKAQKNVYEDGVVVGETDDIELQLKGHDRAAKLLGLNQNTTEVNLTYIDASNTQKDDYGL